MLFLTRKPGQSVMIGDTIRLTVTRVTPDRGARIDVTEDLGLSTQYRSQISLGRQQRQRVADTVDVMVRRVDGGSLVRLGFCAPRNVPILRQEVYDRE